MEKAVKLSNLDREAATLSYTLAARLQHEIMSGHFEIGSALGSERTLMERYDCSRASVREALRLLRGQGFIEVRRGRQGGWFIAEPTKDPLIRSLDRLIAGQSFRWLDLVNAREAIEAAAAVQAAEHTEPEKLRRLCEANEACENSIDNFEAFVDANLKWHLALAEASGNPLFVAFLMSISTAMHAATDLEEFDFSVRKAVVGIHWQIYNAIAEGDAEKARRRTLRHLEAYRSKLGSVEDLAARVQADAMRDGGVSR